MYIPIKFQCIGHNGFQYNTIDNSRGFTFPVSVTTGICLLINNKSYIVID